MSYKALYRTYRPQIFKDVTGQEVVVKTLQNAIKNNKISHAYLFCGPRGTGKTSIARIFAKALNCTNLNVNEPCDECISCKEISQGINPDVIEIDAASNNGVDEIRDIREKVKYLPSGSKYKIYIIDEVHMLSGGAFNALLKTLEEPPKHVVFILATTEPQKLPATIVSRCQRYEFKSLGVEEISERLKQICDLEDVTITEEALNSISESAEGAMRDPLSILDQAISYGNKNIQIDDINGVTGSLSFDKVIGLGNAIENKNIHNTLEIIHELLSCGKEISKIINGLLVFYRDVLLYKSIGESGYSKYIFEKEEFKEFASKANISKIMYLIDILCDIQSKVKFSTTPNIFLEIALIKMCNVSSDDLDILKRINELENKINNVSNIEVSTENIVVDNDKVNILEAKVNQILNELNRLELRKQIERIEELKVAINNISVNSNSGSLDREIQTEIAHLKDKIDELDLFVNKEDNTSNDELLEKVNELEQKISSNVSVSGDSDLLIKINELEEKISNNNSNEIDLVLEKINVLENKLNNINVNNSSNSSQVELSDVYAKINQLETKGVSNSCEIDLSGIYSRLTALEIKEVNNDVEFLKEDKINELDQSVIALKDDIDKLKEYVTDIKNIQFENYDFSEISEKLMFLEKRIYQIIAGELSTSKSIKKEPKKNNGQIMLFGDDILSVADLDESKKERIDFEDLQKEELIEETAQEETEVVKDVVVEEVKEEVVGEITEEQPQEDVIEEEIIEDDNAQEQEINTGLFETEPVIVPMKEEVKQKPVSSIYFDVNTNSQVIHNEHSSIVIRQKEEVLPVEEVEQNVVVENDNVNNNVVKVEEEPQKDKLASYNVKYIEQILHDSRSIEARNDKVRMEQVWKNMTRGARPEQLAVIEVLQAGMVAVVGNKQFIISFPDVRLCNMVMRSNFKEVAVRILYNLLGDKYNYIALPNDAWSKVSAEYKGQYQIGIKYPTLTPLKIVGLEVIEEEYESDTQKAINKTLKMFGQDNVKIE